MVEGSGLIRVRTRRGDRGGATLDRDLNRDPLAGLILELFIRLEVELEDMFGDRLIRDDCG